MSTQIQPTANMHDAEMWDDLWINAHLVTMNGSEDNGYGIIKNGAIAVADGAIAWAGEVSALPNGIDQMVARLHDVDGALVTPGLIDCHTHLVYAGSRAQEFEMRLEGKSYADIAAAGGGILSTVQAVRDATEGQLFTLASTRLQAMMARGVTAVEIKSGYGLDTEHELKMLHVARRLADRHPVMIRTTLLAAHAVPPEFKDNPDGYIDLICEEIIPQAAKSELVDAVDGFCESVGFSPAQIERVFKAAKKHALPVKLHAEQLSNQGGAMLAARYQALSADHLEYIDEAGVKAMAKAKMVAVLLPGAFYYLQESQKPPIDLFRKYNVPMAVASDCNPGTSPTFNLPLMMNMACTLFGLTPLEALAGTTRHAARALGVEREIGTLEVGKKANFTLWDAEHPAELSACIGLPGCQLRVYQGEMV